MLLFVSWWNKYAIIEWPLFDAPKSTHGVFTSFSLSRYCCLHFCRKKVWAHFDAGIFYGSKFKHYSQIATFYVSVWYAIIEWPLFDAPSSTHGVFTSLVYLSAVAYISVEISLGSCWCKDILRVKDQGFIPNCNFLWLCVICNHQVVTTRCAIKYPWCFYFF